MNFKKLIQPLVCVMGLVSINASAGASLAFKGNCDKTTAKVVEGVKLKSYFSDTNTNMEGTYLVSTDGKVWVIPGGQYYPDDYLAEEERKIALAALMSGMKVNICSKEGSKPNRAWAIELDAE